MKQYSQYFLRLLPVTILTVTFVTSVFISSTVIPIAAAVEPAPPQPVQKKRTDEQMLRDGLSAIRSGRINQGRMDLLQLAGQGNSQAQFELGRFYAEGRHIPRDISRALLTLTLAQENGVSDTRIQPVFAIIEPFVTMSHRAALQEELGSLFIKGGPVEADAQKAVSWLEKRVLNSIPFADSIDRGELARKIGKIYEEDIFSFTEAHSWYTFSEALGTERSKRDRLRMELFLHDSSLEQSKDNATQNYKVYLKGKGKFQ